MSDEKFNIKPEDQGKYQVALQVASKTIEIGPKLPMDHVVVVQEWLQNGGAKDIWQLLEMPEGGLAIILQQKEELTKLRAELQGFIETGVEEVVTQP